MIIDLRAILHGSHHFDFALEQDWWQDDEENAQVLGLDGPMEVHVGISKVGSKYVLDGCLLGRLMIRCDRCLEPYYHDLKSEFRLLLALPHFDAGKSEIELSEDDMLVDFVTDKEIDLGDIVREQIYLALPIKSLCRKDCLGLCPVCGVNLNTEECKCRRETGHPGFSKLKDLKFKGECNTS